MFCILLASVNGDVNVEGTSIPIDKIVVNLVV